MTVDLANYDNRGYHLGRGALVRTLWYVCNAFLLASWLLPLSGHIVAAAMVHRVPLVVTLNGDDFKDFSAHITCLKPAEAVERLAKKRM